MNSPVKVILSWSSGKDGAWALHALRSRSDVEVVGLLSTINEEAARIAMHAVRRELLEAQAAATGLPLIEVPIPYPCSNAEYEARMADAVHRAKQHGVAAFAFGDLFLSDVREYREAKLGGVGMRALFPLWGRDTTELAREMVAQGLRAVMTCIDPARLDRSFAGRAWDRSLDALPPGIDPCGERGEFHTFVHEGPMLAAPIRLARGATIERDGFVFTDFMLGEDPEAQA